MSDVVIAPSILAADFGHLYEEIKKVEAATSFLHIDVMDGHYVPNITFGVPVVESIRKGTNMVFDVHLMVTNPMDFFEPFAKAGADMLTFHVETVDDPVEAIGKVRKLGKRVGISIHPDTPIEKVLPYAPMCDLVLIMSVRPGFGGQHFMEEALARIAAVRKVIDEAVSDTIISVDGGICDKTAPRVVSAGANYLVAGSAVFSKDDHAAAVRELLSCALS
ncbi:MAG: ribulose-phosphate 3-epimerase [Clostridiales bacterium]|nr:ribulose-phosphate 3-epimerase [Clostridiales bacterium]